MRPLFTLSFVLIFITAGFSPHKLLKTAETKSEPDARDLSLFQEKQALTAQHSPHAARAVAVAKSFLGAPYVTGTLEAPAETEHLVVNLRQLDCWTLMENSMAIALTGPEGNYQDFQQHLLELRYWGGHLSDYGSRIHYFSGWLLQAEKLGYLRDITTDIGGLPYRKKLGYISARPGKYPKIKRPEILHALQAAEARINQHPWQYIPKSKVAAIEHLLREGDLILLTSAKRDLDIAHQGFAVKIKGRIHLLHASSLAHRVVISAQPLPQYMSKQKGQSGIMVARLND